MRNIVLTLTLSVIAGVALPAQQSTAPKPTTQTSTTTPGGAGTDKATQRAMSLRYDSLKWQTIVPELGSDSPQISILRVDPGTHATQLLIRVPKRMHVPMHWHSANETHTVIRGMWVFDHEGKRDELGPGSFNYMPAKMHHQAWASDDALVLITVDSAWDITWINGPPTKTDLGKTPTDR